MGEKKRRQAFRKLGPNLVGMAWGEVTPWQMPGIDADLMIMEIATKGEITRERCRQAADWVAGAVPLRPGVVFSLTVGGYDNDPREVPDIPEAMRAFCWFGERLQELDLAEAGQGVPRLINRLNTISRTLVLLSMGLFPREKLVLNGAPLAIKDEYWRQDKERAAIADEAAAARDAQPHTKQ